MTPEVTISELLDVARQSGVVLDRAATYDRGSDYEALSGPNAILWSRQTQRDTDLWRAIRFGDASSEDLTEMGELRYGIPRVLDTRGVGLLALHRPTSGGGAGTFWRGTRIRVATGSDTTPLYYRVVADYPIGATALYAMVPIEAVEYGPGSTILTHLDAAFDDILWDSSWQITTLVCAPGTVLEPAAAYRARIRATRFAARVGHEDAIVDACKAAGAGQVALFSSDYAALGRQYGLNYVYVGDLGYTGTTELVRACTLALRSVRVAGDNLQVLPLASALLTVDVDIYLRDDPTTLPIDRLDYIHRQAIIQYMNGADGSFAYSLRGIESAIAKASIDVQEVDFVAPTEDNVIHVNGTFPDVLNRYHVNNSSIVTRYHGPK